MNDLSDTTDGSCGAPDCTLREAIDLANSNGSAVTDDINFGGVVSGQISVASALSALTTPTNIDGTTATGYTGPDPVIEIDGGGAVTDGIQVQASNSTIRGVSINGFTDTQIYMTGPGGNNSVVGSYIGVAANGNTAGNNADARGIFLGAASANNTIGTPAGTDRNVISGAGGGGAPLVIGTGIRIDGTGNSIRNNYIGTADDGATEIGNDWGIEFVTGVGNTIGGTGANEENVISGNTQEGVRLNLGSSSNSLIGNIIGLSASQLAAVPNQVGIHIPQANDNDIGGSGPNEGNVISGNDQEGVLIAGPFSSDNRVRGNLIGTDNSGLADFGNGSNGVRIDDGADDNVIGGTGFTDRNVIANSVDNGVVVTNGGSDATGNQILGNRIFGNGSLAIDLGAGIADGPTSNDLNDADLASALANEGQNFPVINSVVSASGIVTASITLDFAKPDTPYRIEIYRNAACNPPGLVPFGEGETLATAVTPSTNGSGDLTFTGFVPGAAVGDVVTATATDVGAAPQSGTSEFSACKTVTAASSGGPGGPGPPPSTAAVPGPVTGKSFNASVVKGDVSVKCPGDGRFRGIKGKNDLRIGCQIDTRKGRVSVTTTAAGPRTQTAQFYDGLFKVGQTRGKKPITELRLTGKLENCGKRSKRASTAARKRRGRRLWGNGKGRFRTRGKRSSALVRGTIWLVEDRCDGSTLTQVRRGTVTVRDFVKRKNVTVKRGRRYVAKPRG